MEILQIARLTDMLVTLRTQFGWLMPDKSHRQVGALCYRHDNAELQILLITTRRTGRWIIPKGWPIEGLADHEAAAREAFEEAGVEGRIGASAIGRFNTLKFAGDDGFEPHVIDVYPLEVSRLLDDFPEACQRRRMWYPASIARAHCMDKSLSDLIGAVSLNPTILSGASQQFRA